MGEQAELADVSLIVRQRVSNTVLPESPRWLYLPNDLGVAPGQAFLATYMGKLVAGQCVSDSLLGFCTIERRPEGSNDEHTEEFMDWKLDEVSAHGLWATVGVSVDMSATGDLLMLDSHYLKTVFGAPLTLFAKSALTRARVGTHQDLLSQKLREMVRSPELLSDKWDNLKFGSDKKFSLAYEDWCTALPSTVTASDKPQRELLKRETQLQVIIMLELLVLGQPYEPLLDQHFDRLCIIQAIEGNKADQVLEFCSQVIVPYFRSSLPTKTKELVKKSRGVFHAGQKVRLVKTRKVSLERPRIAPTLLHGEAVTTLLADHSESSSRISAPSMPSKPASGLTISGRKHSENQSRLERAGRTASRKMLVNQRRQVDISFGPIVTQTSQTSTTVKSTKASAQTSQPLSLKSTSEPVCVERSPASSKVITLTRNPVPVDLEFETTDNDD